jgi:DNA-binding beta-propeller fold protein YncE
MRKKKLIFMVVIFSLLLSVTGIISTKVQAAPYDSYNYSFWEYAVHSPAPYLPTEILTGSNLGAGDFKEPHDLFVTDDGKVYVADSGNHRIVIFDKDWNFIREISGFMNEGSMDNFKLPTGVYVTHEGDLYIADRENNRVVVLNKEGVLKLVIENPQAEILPENFRFSPNKVGVDSANRIFVVAQGVYEGLMEFSDEGNFDAFVGTNSVRPNAADYFWRLIATRAQREQMVMFIPTEFTNLDIDDRNFIYATNIDPGTDEPIKRINAFGNDILKRHGFHDVSGDLYALSIGPYQGRTQFLDIEVMPDGKYSALDGLKGRIFTYDDDGNLLYMFGGTGTQKGTFRTPVALAVKEENILVLDRQRAMITSFAPSAFGSSVNKAIHYHYNGIMDKAEEAWEEVLKLNANYELAYLGIGKSLLRQQQSKEALEMFELGMDRDYYGIAYKRYRRNTLKEHYQIVLTMFTILAVGFFASRIYFRIKRKRGGQSASE